MLDATVLTTAGLVYTLFHMTEISRIDARAEFAVGFLKKIAVNSLSVLHAGGGHCYLPNGATLSFDSSGVCNVYDCLQCHKGIKDSFKATWADMKEEGMLSTVFEAASIIDVVVFCASVRRYRRRLKKRPWSQGTTNVWSDCLWSVVKFLSAAVNHRCRHLQRVVGDIATRAIPSRRRRSINRGDLPDDDDAHDKLV